MSDVVVYGFPQSTYVRTARMCLHEKGVDYALEPVNVADDGYEALHPFRKVPAFRHGDFHLYETAAIAQYIDMAFDGPALTPDDARGTARMVQWISNITSYFYSAMIQRCVIERFAPVIMGREPDEATIKAALPDIEYQLGVLDAALGDSVMLAGEAPSIADYLLAPIMFYMSITEDSAPLVKARTNVARWHAAIETRASYQETIPELPG